jgi:choline-sulfatase
MSWMPLALAVAAVAPAPAPNLLLVTIDTLRADHLRCYGYAEIETPVADRLAREGLLFEDVAVQVPQTRPSHASILTGLLPYEHGIRDNYSSPLDPRFPTLATILKGRGYGTAAFIGSYALASISGLNHGFDHYDEPFGTRGGGTDLFTRPERRGGEVVDSALAWLGRHRKEPFFVWVHLYDPHAPYVPPSPYDRRYAGRPYDGEVAYADAQVGRLVEFLDARGLRGRTLVVVTSDHGEGLGEHGEDEHLMFVYESTLRVPLLASWPGVLPAGQRIRGLFRSVDLLPTVLDLLGQPAVASSGTSRAREARAGAKLPDDTESYAESLFGQIHFAYAPLRALRAEGYKYIDAPRAELYNLRDDPGEKKNLIGLRAGVVAHLTERLATYDKAVGETPPLAAPDAGTMERLAALGYVGGGGSRGLAKGADPKDKIQEYQSYTRDVQRAIELYARERFDEALPLLRRLWTSDVASLEVAYFLGKCELRRERYSEAAKALEEALELVPRFTEAYVDLSHAYAGMGRLADARSVVERGLRMDPRNAALLGEQGMLLQRLGDLPASRAALERARDLDPGNPRVRLALSAVYRDQGQLAPAVAEVREAARLAPDNSNCWNALGQLLVSSGEPGEADAAFSKGLEARPDDPDILFFLGRLRLEAHRPQEALPLLERLAGVAPRYPGGAQALEEVRARLEPLAPGRAELRLLRVAERSRADALARRLEEGADFATLARSDSIDSSAAAGGRLGVVRLGDLAEPLRTAAAALAVGAVSPVVETASGYVILKRER